ncbi:MAG: apolipoprotein N-acyltransferase [Candidatus Eisenbacteria bacterium]
MRRVRLHRSVAASIVCLSSGLSIGFCFWPYRTGLLAYFLLVPFIVVSGLRDGRGRFLLNSYIFGFGYFMGSLYWIAMLQKDQITLPWLRLPAAVLLCLYLALFMLLVGYLSRRLVLLRVPYEIALAIAWGGVEYLRSLGPLGFPWASLGYSQVPYPPVIQQAAVVGTYGLSAWIVLVNGLLARLALSRRAWLGVVVAAVFGLPVLGGALVLSHARSETDLRVALVQPNISGAVKWDEAYRDSTMEVLTEMTLKTRGADMIVWPETAVPLYAKHEPSYLQGVTGLARATGSYLLTGFPDYERTLDGIEYYNAAMLVSPAGEIVGEYRKIHLVPFGEMIPFEDRIPLLREINFGEGDFSPGTSYDVFEVGAKRFGVAICFESIYPSLVRKFVGNGADFVVNITNDEWFGPSAGPFQHAEMAVMRCVECRVGLVRCANTGVSMLVDPYGRVTERTRIFSREVLVGRVATAGHGTPYLRWGYIGELILILTPVTLAVLSYLPGLRRGKRSGQKPLTAAGPE